MSDGRLNFHFHNGTAWKTFFSNAGITLNTWHFVAVKYNSSAGGEFIIDNKTSGTIPAAGAITKNNIDLFIGTESDPNYRDWLNGFIDEILIFNRVLTTSEIKTLYELGAV